MSDLHYSLISNDAGKNITVFYQGEVYAATDTHANWEAIKAGAENDDVSIVDLFDLSQTASKRFERLSERVTVNNGHVYFDGVAVNNTLTNQVVRFIENGEEDFGPLVAFFEKVQVNENEHSREQLYRWLAANDFTITADGNFIGYKGVKIVDGEFFSISTGKAISNGVEYNGAIPNPIGAIVEMPRDAVQHDPSVGCHTGLHAGTWDYASGFAQGAVLKVEINPRDVVSVPTDCSSQKVRTCRYTVLEVIDAPVYGPVEYDYADDEDDYSDVIKSYEANNPVVQTMAGPVDTRFNYQKQKRDQFGRFIPKTK